MAKKAKNDHIVVIRFSALGDVAMTVPVLRALSKQYPELTITVVSRGFHKPLFHGIERINFHEAELSGKHKRFFGLWRLYRELKRLSIDAVADLHNVLRSNILKVFLVLGALKVVQIDKGRAEKKALTRKKNKIFKPLKTTHERYADVFAALGYPVKVGPDDIMAPLEISDEVKKIVGNKSETWIGIAPFAAHSGKMYPFEKMANVINALKNTKKYKIVLFGGGKAEKERLESLASPNEQVFSMAGRLSLEEELQLISNLDLMVSMDSANAHLAANFGVEVITLWGVTHPYAGFYPFGQPLSNAILSDRGQYPAIPTSIYGNKVPQGYENVMESISEQTIIAKIEEVLAKQA